MAGFREDGLLYVSASSLETIAHCSTKSWLIVNGYTTQREAAELLAGVAIHAAKERYFKSGSKREAMGVFAGRYQDWAVKNQQWFQRLNYDSVSRILGRWFDERPLEKLPYRAYPGLIEKTLHWPLTDDGKIILVMRPDLVAYIGSTDGICIVDHKSTGKINEYFKAKFELNPQLDTYWWGIEQILQRPVTSFYINAIELPRLPAFDDQKRCKKHQNTWRGKCGHLHAQFHVFTYRRTPAQIKEWHRTAIMYARLMYDNLLLAPDISHLHKIPMNGMFTGHCQICPMSEFCKAGRPVNRINEYLMPLPLTPEERRIAA